MDSFESVVAMLLRREGYWTASSVKVKLEIEEKRAIGLPTTPRWELDLVAYRGSSNEVLAVECKSYLDSKGVVFRDGCFDIPKRYKLFVNQKLREVVLRRLSLQLQEIGACRPNPIIRLCLATGKLFSKTNRKSMRSHFAKNEWLLFDNVWIREKLELAAGAGYEDDVAHVVAKILTRK